MADLTVVAVLTAKAGGADVVGKALADLVEPTRAEPGNISYDLYESHLAPGTFITVERWAGQADLDAHMQTPHIAAALTSAGEYLEAPAIHPLRPVSEPA